MKISECNDLWDLVNNDEVQNVTTIINSSFDPDNYDDEIFEAIEDDLALFFEDKFREYADGVDLEFSKYQYDREMDYKLKILEQNSTENDCDMACQMKKTFESQMEMELLKANYCEILPHLPACSDNNIQNETKKSADSDYVLTQIQASLGNLDDKITAIENQPKKESQSNYFVIGIMILIAIALGVYGYFTNKKTQGIFVPKEKIQENTSPINDKENRRETLLNLAKKRQEEDTKPKNDTKNPTSFIR